MVLERVGFFGEGEENVLGDFLGEFGVFGLAEGGVVDEAAERGDEGLEGGFGAVRGQVGFQEIGW